MPGESHDHVHQKAMFFAYDAVNRVNFFAESADAGKIVHKKIAEQYCHYAGEAK